MPWTWIDFAIIGIVGLSVFTGLMRGFVKELVALIAWVLAVVLSFEYMHWVAAALKPYIHEQVLRSGLAFTAILLAVLLLGGIVNTVLSFLLRHSGLSGTDRILGMGFGLARGVLIVVLILLAASMTDLPTPADRKASRLYSYFSPLVAWMAAQTQPLLARVTEKNASSLRAVGEAIQRPAP